MTATEYPAREQHLCDAYEVVAALQKDTRLAEHVDPTRRQYHGRPFQVLHAERFARALAQTITDHALRALPLSGSWISASYAISRVRDSGASRELSLLRAIAGA